MKVAIAREADKNKWNTYIETKKGPIFQRWEWKYIIEKSLSYKSFFLIAINQKRQVCGILPLFIIHDNQNTFLQALPCTGFLELLADTPKITQLLLQHALKHANLNNYTLKIITPNHAALLPVGASLNKVDIVDYRLHPKTEQNYYDNLAPERKWRLRRFKKTGFTLRQLQKRDLLVFYNIYCETQYRLRVRPLPLDVFSLAFKHFRKDAYIIASVLHDKITAISWSFLGSETTYVWRSAYKDKISKLGSADVLLAHVIEKSYSNSTVKTIDAGISRIHDGTAHYKESFGFTPIDLFMITNIQRTSTLMSVFTRLLQVTKILTRKKTLIEVLKGFVHGQAWIPEINVGTKKLLMTFASFVLFIGIFIAVGKFELALLLGGGAVVSTLVLLQLAAAHGIYIRLISLTSQKQKLEIVDHIFPTNSKKSFRMLRYQDDPAQRVQTAIFLDKSQTASASYDYCRLFAELFWGNRLKRSLVLGAGGGAVPIIFSKTFSQCATDAIELDNVIISVARKFFITNTPRIHLQEADAQQFLETCKPNQYEFIFNDLFITDKIPSFVFSNTYLNNLKRALKENGTLVINTGRDTTNAINILLPQLKKHFTTVHVFLSDKCFVFLLLNTTKHITKEMLYKKTHTSRFYGETIEFLETSYLSI